MTYKSIAIDGPSGAGKSTLAKLLAGKLSYLYVDTGAIYRTVGLYAYRKGVASGDEARVAALLPNLNIDLGYADHGLQHMYLNGEDVTTDIRLHEISQIASAVSAIGAVRDFLLQMQRDLAGRRDVIMDGRDIGTVVLPNANLKIYLTATPEDRARRRHVELLERGQNCDYNTVLHDVAERDERDMNRTIAPLRCAEDAVLLDTTGLLLEESFTALYHIVKERLGL